MSHHDAYEAPLLYDLDQRTASLEQFAQRYPQAWELLNHSIGELRVVQNIWPAHNAEATPYGGPLCQDTILAQDRK